MTGSPSEPGLTPRAVCEIFRLIEDRKHCDCKVTAYFVELYNDQLVDLLWLVDSKDKDRDREKESKSQPQPPHLDIKLDGNKMVYVKGAVVKDAHSTEDLLQLFTKGNAERHTGSTNMNAESSRSHSVFSIMVSDSLAQWLYCSILYYTILYYTILYYTILYYTILYYTILYYTILYYTILYYAAALFFLFQFLIVFLLLDANVFFFLALYEIFSLFFYYCYYTY